MSELNTITLNGIEYVKKSSNDEPIKIVVLDKNFVYVGQLKIENEYIVITNAKNIRKWGTTKGLGELINGPLDNTILDNTGIVRAPLRSLILTIEVEQEKWK